jgi:ribosomal protein S27E
MVDEMDWVPRGFERLPLFYYVEDLARHVSWDGQLYLHDANPKLLCRVEPSSLESNSKFEEVRGKAVRFAEHLDVRCHDCGELQTVESVLWVELRCLKCGSRHVDILASRNPIHNYQIRNSGNPRASAHSMFAQVDGHVWCEDVVRDTKALAQLDNAHRKGTEHDRYLNILAMFCQTLLKGYSLKPKNNDLAYYRMLFPVGTITQRAYREGGLRPAGRFAMECFRTAIDGAPSPSARAVAQH